MRIARSVLVGLLLLSPAARAQDACLTGDTTLGDQRALAALGTATEAACPCAEAINGKTYQNSSVLRYVIPFLERYLGQRVDLIPLLGPPTGPGFV